jgi:acyl-CoA hydrolase
VGVKAWVEHPQTGELRHVASAYLVFVAIDEKGKRVRVPPILPETADEQRRYADAQLRRQHREAEAARRKVERSATANQENTAATQSK